MSMSSSVIICLCFFLTVVTKASAQDSPGAAFETSDSQFVDSCGLTKCLEPLLPLQNLEKSQALGQFNVTVFKEICRVYPEIMACIKSASEDGCAMPGMPGPKPLAQAMWASVKEALHYICVEKQADFLEVAPCLANQKLVMQVNGCSMAMQQHAMSFGTSPDSLPDKMAKLCSVIDDFLECVTNTLDVCGQKAVVIFSTLLSRFASRMMASMGQKCTLTNVILESKGGNNGASRTSTNLLIVGVCALVLLVAAIAVFVYMKIRRKHGNAPFMHQRLIDGAQSPAYEDK